MASSHQTSTIVLVREYLRSTPDEVPVGVEYQGDRGGECKAGEGNPYEIRRSSFLTIRALIDLPQTNSHRMLILGGFRTYAPTQIHGLERGIMGVTMPLQGEKHLLA